MPQVGNSKSAAVAFVNRRTDGIARDISLDLTAAGLTHPEGYDVLELFDGVDLGRFPPSSTLTARVNPTGKHHMQLLSRDDSALCPSVRRLHGEVDRCGRQARLAAWQPEVV